MPTSSLAPAALTAAHNDLLSEQQTADYLGGLKPATLAHWRTTGKADQPPFIRIGRLIRYRRRDLDEWLEARTVRPVAELN